MWWVAVAVLLLVVLLAAALWAYQTATRLDRLHVRYDLSWQALDAALARRAVVARAVATDAYGSGEQCRRLTDLADAAERTPRPARETAENELSAELAAVDMSALPPALIAELADAEARVLLARRFHNDAVRDTLALRERRPVRWLRLGGTAPLPTYFEIAERAQSSGDDAGVVTVRTSARVVLLDEDGRVLLFCGSDPARAGGEAPKWWFTVGGQARPGETLQRAAAREVYEETGLHADPEQMIGPVWRRDAMLDFNNSVVRSHELFFVHRTRRFDPSTAGHTALERRYIHDFRWCDPSDIAALVDAGEAVYPVQLADLLPEANALADASSATQRREPQPIR
ncbi:MAG TPA: NUDIX domain-containing protein [Mycobacterium sp.]